MKSEELELKTIEIIYKSMLKESAKRKSQLFNDISQILEQLVFHLTASYLWNDSTALNHWQGEIYACIHRVSRLKGTNKLPTQEQLYNEVFEDAIQDIEDNTETIVQDVCDNENINEIPEYNKQNLINYVSEYIMWLCSILSEKGRISKQDVYNEIELLQNKYNKV